MHKPFLLIAHILASSYCLDTLPSYTNVHMSCMATFPIISHDKNMIYYIASYLYAWLFKHGIILHLVMCLPHR